MNRRPDDGRPPIITVDDVVHEPELNADASLRRMTYSIEISTLSALLDERPMFQPPTRIVVHRVQTPRASEADVEFVIGRETRDRDGDIVDWRFFPTGTDLLTTLDGAVPHQLIVYND